MAASAMATDGQMVTPHMVRAMVNDGVQYNIPPLFAGAPITEETAETLTEMLAYSLEEEASTALVTGYRLAGKTGTGEIPTESGYTRGVTNTSFVGWGPVDDPRFVIYVWLEEPSISIWGSEVAAPVFAEIVERLVVLLDLPPDDLRNSLANQ
jgi:cell division protein FtsI (penicillin-binding protein 3)